MDIWIIGHSINVKKLQISASFVPLSISLQSNVITNDQEWKRMNTLIGNSDPLVNIRNNWNLCTVDLAH